MNIISLAPDATRLSDIAKAFAKARGCRTAAEIDTFLDPLPPITNPLASAFPEFEKAAHAIALAVSNGEVICVYGDSDADGVCATAQMVRFLRLIGAAVRWFVPNSNARPSGLSIAGLSQCIEAHHPKLLIAVDCGSNSVAEIGYLRKRAIDAIILDHHPLTTDHPGSVALINPQHSRVTDPTLTNLSASGLAYLFADAYARKSGLDTTWNRIREGNLLLAATGTIADTMPLVSLNRTLVKHALAFANSPDGMAKMPGLAVLVPHGNPTEITVTSITRVWSPRLNACGQMTDASIAVQLLLSTNQEEARPFARMCEDANIQRRALQQRILASATEQACQQIETEPSAKALVLHDMTWPPSVTNHVAAALRATFNRPVVALGWMPVNPASTSGGHWSGSARASEEVDLNQIITEAIHQGLVVTGGGHANAAGLAVSESKLPQFKLWFIGEANRLCCGSSEPIHEVLGGVFDCTPDQWMKLLRLLGPFGAGNPQPFLSLRHAKLARPPVTRRSRPMNQQVGTPFAVTGVFHEPQSPACEIQLDWHKPEEANHTWFAGRCYDIVVVPIERTSPHPSVSWRVVSCEPAA